MSGDASGNGEERGGDHDGDAGSRAVVQRRKRLFAGSVVAALPGMAVVVLGLRQFPGLPPVVPFGAGTVTTALAFGAASVGVFRLGEP